MAITSQRKTTKSKNGFFIYLCIIMLFSNFMSYVGPGALDGKFVSQICRMVLLLFIPVVLLNYNRYPRVPLLKASMWLMFFGLLSMVGAYVIHGQSFGDSFVVTSYAFVFLMFPLMYILKVDERSIIKLIFVIGVWWAFTEFIQQFTWPTYWFGGRGGTEEDGPEMRNGIIRYGVGGGLFGLLMLFYSFQKYLEEGKRKYLIYIIIGLVGVYLTCTRQTIAASLGCLLVGLYLKGKMKLGAMIGITALGVIIYLFSDTLFGEYIEMSQNDVENDEYVRFIGYRFFGLEYNKDNPLAILIGNGYARYDHSAYGSEMEKYSLEYGLNLNDIGYVGTYFNYGLIYILIVFYTFYYVFKNRRYISLYLQLYVLYMAVTGIMLMHFSCYNLGSWTTILVWYLIEKEISAKKPVKSLR